MYVHSPPTQSFTSYKHTFIHDIHDIHDMYVHDIHDMYVPHVHDILDIHHET